MQRFAGFGLPFAFALPMPSVLAAEAPAATSDHPPDMISGADMTGSVIWVIFALLFVIVLIVIVLKWLSRRTWTWGANRRFRQLGGVPLGQHKSLQAVEFGGRIYLLGVGDDITLIEKIEDRAEVEAVLASLRAESPSGIGAAPLQRLIEKFAKRRDGESPAEEEASFERTLREKLELQTERKREMERLLKETKQSDRLTDE
jgi:Flagellar biogenesis protein